MNRQQNFISAREIAQLVQELRDPAATAYPRRKLARMIRAWNRQQGFPTVKVTVTTARPIAA